MRPSRWLGLLVLVVVSRGVPALATTAADVCSGDPCVLTTGVTVTPGSVLDFGARAFRIAKSGRLSTADGDTLTIIAGSVTMEGGAIIRGPQISTIGITVRIEADEDILIQRSAIGPARIEVQGQTGGGTIELDAGGNLDLAGELRADGTTADGNGGTVEVLVDGDMTMSGLLKINGGRAADGGSVTITVDGALLLGRIDASGGLGGGSLDVLSGLGLTTTGLVSVAGTVAGSAGGDVTLNGGSVIVAERITAQAQGSLADGGLGGDVEITSPGNIQVNARIDTFADGQGGQAGIVTIEAEADVRQTQPISAHGAGGGADGGGVDLAAGGLLEIDGLIEVNGLTAGDVSGFAGTQVRARAEIDADGARGGIDLGTLSPAGTEAPGPVVVSGDLHARAPAGGISGRITIKGCDVSIDALGRLSTAGTGAANLLGAGRQMTVSGQVSAASGTNTFQYRNPPGLVPVVTGAVDPAPTISDVGTALLACGPPPPPPVCGNGMTESGEGCDDDNTTACDGCSPACALEACGNAMVECTEGCDDGNVADGDGCDANCTNTGCGNGRLTSGEGCDDGNTTAGDGCDASCQIEAPPGCGNGMTEDGEECDDGNTTACDGCSHICLTEGCGNNRLECAELCDAGNTLDCDGDGCTDDCLGLEVCGNGVTECQEQCDAGASNSQPGSGCNSLCRVCALGSGDCPCGADTDCHPLGRCGGLACVDGVCASVEAPACDDGNACNGVESCSDGACVVGTPLQCADADPCTADSCDPAPGCLHPLATGIPSVACRVEAFRLALDAAPLEEVALSLRQRLDKAAGKLQAAVDAANAAGGNVKRLRRLLKSTAKRARKLVRLVDKGARKDQLPAALADTLRAAANGAFSAADGLRRDLTT